jgi:hypothetical protein
MKHPQHRRSIWLGSLAAALAPRLCVLVPELFRLSDRGSIGYLLSNSVIFLTVAVSVSLVAMLCIGLPYVLWLRSRGSLNAITVCIGSVVSGVAVFSLLTGALSWDHRSPGLSQIGLGAALGLAAGVAFSLAAGLTIRSSRSPIATRLGSA